MKRLLNSDEMTGIATYHEYDPMTKETIITSTQKVEPHINISKELQQDEQYSRDGIKNCMWHVAHIPNIVMNKWLIEDGIDVLKTEHRQAVLKKLRDPEWKYLKTTAGRIG